MDNSNPLRAYYRHVKTYITLPSGTNYYTSNVIDFTESGEVGVMAMTGEDEVSLKSPDAIMNGEAVKRVLLSCVEGLKKPEYLLNNDVDALMIAIKHVTYGDSNEYSPVCPACGHRNLYKFDVGQLLQNMQSLEADYSVDISNGLRVYIKPYMFKDRIATFRVAFEQEKIRKSIDSSDEEVAIRTIGQSIKTMTELNYQIITNAIVAITNGDGMDIKNDDTNRAAILGLLRNISATDFASIEEKLNEINKIGVGGSVSSTCSECNHQWEADVDLNPINFSIAS